MRVHLFAPETNLAESDSLIMNGDAGSRSCCRVLSMHRKVGMGTGFAFKTDLSHS